MSSLWENSRIRDNNCFYNSKTLSDFFMRLDPGGVSRPSWGARHALTLKFHRKSYLGMNYWY